ncbi:hypothetical protein MMC25_003911 [Agyrium rufum]|nr:hypothetical protein [Agyrium rufum]
MSLTNVYHLRTVAETSSKACYICYKPTTAVMVTPDSKDFFYICRGHLLDRGFCSPIIDEAEAAAKKKQAELEKEIELVKKEYEEKLKRKKKGKEDKKKDKDKLKDEKDKEKDDEDLDATEKEKDEKIKALTNKDSGPKQVDIPRIYALHK